MAKPHPTLVADDPRRLPVPPAWRGPIGQWAAWRRAAGHSRQTIETRLSQLSTAARRLGPDPWAVTGADLDQWAAAQTWARETRRANYAAVRTFYRWAVSAGHINTSPVSLPPVRPAEPLARPTPTAIYKAALLAADQRTTLILRLAAETGMRRCETAAVHTDDIGEDLLGATITAHGKGGKLRVLPVPDDLARAVLKAKDWLFPGDYGGHLSPRWVGKLARRVLPGQWTLHTLRHRYGTMVYNRGDGDLLAVQRLLGHASPATTQRCVLLEQARLHRAARTA
jgi:integrase